MVKDRVLNNTEGPVPYEMHKPIAKSRHIHLSPRTARDRNGL